MAKGLSEVCSEADLRRFAICLLHSDRANIDWAKASMQYDPKVQVASFKTVTNKALKRVQDALAINANEGTAANNNGDANPSKSKRDASSEEAEGSPAKKRKGTPKAKGKKSAAEQKGSNGAGVKEESPAEDDAV